jgi:protein-L-isoaspartate O-methyltransferase
LWTKKDSEEVLGRLASAFRKTPRRFFTEHDLHSHLYNLVEKELGKDRFSMNLKMVFR